jgi:sulfur-carrier protein
VSWKFASSPAPFAAGDACFVDAAAELRTRRAWSARPRERERMKVMAVLRLRGPLKRLAGDRSEHAIEGDSVGELLLALEREQPAARGWILDERGVLRRHINVFVNGERAAQDTEVEARDRVDVLPAISGGCAR